MTDDIHEKINEIFSDESINSKRLLFSPKKLAPSKFNKNINDNQVNALTKNEKSAENTNYKTCSSKSKKKHIKKIKENNNKEGNPYTNNEFDILENINDNNSKNDQKDIHTESSVKHKHKKCEKDKKEEKQEKQEKEEIKETDKENESKKDLEIDDDDFPLEKYQQRRARGKSHHIKNKMESMSVFKGILTKDSKKIKKQKFDIEKDNDKNIKIDEKKEEEDENKVSNDELNKTKSKEKKKIFFSSKSKDIGKNKTSLATKSKKNNKNNNDTLNKIRGSIIESKMEIKMEQKNLANMKLSKSPKLKNKKRKKVMSITKYLKQKDSKDKKLYTNLHFISQKKIVFPQKKLTKKEIENTSFNNSVIMSNNDVNSFKYKDVNESDKKKVNNHNDSIISDSESDFKSSQFSKDSENNGNLYSKKHLVSKNNKSSKCIQYIGRKKTFKTNDENRNIIEKKKSHKKLNICDNNNEYISKKEEQSTINKLQSKDSSKFIKNNMENFETHISKVKSFHIDNISNSELKKTNNKRRIAFSNHYQITKNVNNLFISQEKTKNNIYENHNQNMNIINPRNFISIEYNINNGKKDNKHLEINNNHIVINNSNNQSYYKKEMQNNFDIQTQNKIKNKLKDNNDNNSLSNSNKNNLISSNDNILNNNKKTKKKFCFCCLKV